MTETILAISDGAYLHDLIKREAGKILEEGARIGAEYKANKKAATTTVTAFTFLSGFEPLAFRLGGGRSILLSYRNNSKLVYHKQTAKAIKNYRRRLRFASLRSFRF